MNHDYQSFQRMMEFAKRHRPSGAFSNLYVFRKYVNDVQVGDEVYGMNTMTDYGFAQYFSNKRDFPTSLYIGKGTDESVNFKTTQTLISPSTDKAATVISSCNGPYTYNDHYKYPLWYDSTSGLISVICRYMDCRFNDQVSGGPSTDVSITEYGIGTAINELWTHSWLYDLQGDKINNFTKYANERLDIQVFFVLTYDKKLITDALSAGKNIALTTMEFFVNDRFGSDDADGYIFKRNNVIGKLSVDRIIEVGTNSNASVYMTMKPYEIYKGSGELLGYLDGFVQKSNGYICLERQFQTGSREDVDVLIKPPFQILPGENYDSYGSHITANSIATKFGNNSYPDYPFTNIDVSKAYLFNKSTATYSNEVQYQNNPNHQYDETAFGTTCAIAIYYTNTTTGNIIECFLHVNPDVNDSIVKFNNGNTTIYATDEYWNRSSWTLITDVSNVPTELRNKHYYISGTNVTLNPVRESIEFTLTGNAGDRFFINFNKSTTREDATCENYDVGYFVIGHTVYFPNKRSIYEIPQFASLYRESLNHYCYAENIVTFGMLGTTTGNPSYYFTNMSEYLHDIGNITTTQYSCTNATNGFTVDTALNDTYHTETNNGVIGFQALGNKSEFVVMYIQYEVDNPTAGIIGHMARRFRFTSSMGCCIQDTNSRNRIAYYYNKHVYVAEYNVTANTWTQICDFDLPSGYSDPILIFGLNDRVWITNGSSYTHMYNITDTSGTGIACDGVINIITQKFGAKYLSMTSVEDCIILYLHDSNGSYTKGIKFQEQFYIYMQQPTNIHNIPYTDPTSSYIYSRLYMKLKYIRGTTLVLVMGHGYGGGTPGSCIAIADFGKFLNKPVDAATGIDWDYASGTSDSHNNTNRAGIYCYGPYYVIYDYGVDINAETKGFNFIPIEFVLTHRIQGTTKTISAINSVRHVSGKQWMTEVSNIKNTKYGDSGKPPGRSN